MENLKIGTIVVLNKDSTFYKDNKVRFTSRFKDIMEGEELVKFKIVMEIERTRFDIGIEALNESIFQNVTYCMVRPVDRLTSIQVSKLLKIVK